MNANFNLYVSGADFKTFEVFREAYGRQTSKKIMGLIESHMNEVKKNEKRNEA
jgi:hypothetical protein